MIKFLWKSFYEKSHNVKKWPFPSFGWFVLLWDSGGLKSVSEVAKVNFQVTKVKRWPFPNFGWSMLLWCPGVSKANMRSPSSKPEVTRSMIDLFPILADSCWAKRFGGVKSVPEATKVKTWGHKVRKWPLLNFGWFVLLWGPGLQKWTWGHQGQNMRLQGQKWSFPNFGWLVLLWGLGVSKMNLRSLRSKSEVTRSKNDPFPIWADSCSYGVRGFRKWTWGHQSQNLRSQGQKMTFSQFWLICAPMGSGGLKSVSEVTKVKIWGHKF